MVLSIIVSTAQVANTAHLLGVVHAGPILEVEGVHVRCRDTAMGSISGSPSQHEANVFKYNLDSFIREKACSTNNTAFN